MKPALPTTVNFTKEGIAPLRGYIMKITVGGMLVHFSTLNAFKMGDQMKAVFNLRGCEHDFNETVTVVKSYLSYATGSDQVKKKVQLVEMHFVDIQLPFKQMIERFLSQFPTEPT